MKKNLEGKFVPLFNQVLVHEDVSYA